MPFLVGMNADGLPGVCGTIVTFVTSVLFHTYRAEFANVTVVLRTPGRPSVLSCHSESLGEKIL